MLLKENSILQKFQSELRNEEELWRLNYRGIWIKLREKNMKLFHKQANQCVSMNNVSKITTSDGGTMSSYSKIK